ncbi:hypothetical protein [Pelagibius sp.]|uniref:hypothetical protein n=1 Tax=Pelagibius sp. TaxID=1931238 RepID=UPI00263047D8|nr:hypothetical protein [Pelagibius sp.]
MEEWVTIVKSLDLPGQMSVGFFVLLLVVGFCAWCVVVVTLLLIPFNTVPGAITGWLRVAPLNVVLYTSLLTPRGLLLRRWLVGAVVVFIGTVALVFAIGMFAKIV